MIVFRLANPRYVDLSGKGAQIHGGRWNSRGRAMVYTSSSRALALTECLVHLSPDTLPDLVLISIEIPKNTVMEEIKMQDLPKGWDNYPPLSQTQSLGDEFLKNRASLLLKVPSAVVFAEFNYLLNPSHESIEGVKIRSSEKFELDNRLLK